MRSVNKQRSFLLTTIISVLLLAGLLGLAVHGGVWAAGGSVTVSGAGLNGSEATFSQTELQNPSLFEQHTELYSAIDNTSQKYWYKGKGVKIEDLLDKAGGLKPEATRIDFYAGSTLAASFTVNELLNEKRSRFTDGVIGSLPPGVDTREVEPLLAYESCRSQDIINDDANMNDAAANQLLFGQRSVEEKTAAYFAEKVTKIEVLAETSRISLQVTPDLVELFTTGSQKTNQLTVTTYPQEVALNLISSNEEIATVSPTGLITAVKTGGAVITVTAVIDDYEEAEVNVLVKVNPAPGVDTTPPDWPADSALTATVNGNDVSLSWPAATDDSGSVAGYRIYQDDKLLTSVRGTEYKVSDLSIASYRFSVRAEDSAGNVGAPLSAKVTITTKPGVDINDPTVAVFITGDGVPDTREFTQTELKEMSQIQITYSVTNTWPTKKWYIGKGVKLRDLLEQAGMSGSATMIKITAKDGFTQTLTVEELLKTPRYCFPNFMSPSEGHVSGSTAGAYEVEPILALRKAEGSKSAGDMNKEDNPDDLLFMLGQRAVTEQTGELFVKQVKLIEVLTATPSRWGSPQADPAAGMVAAGTKVKLKNDRMDSDKIYYTTDGSTPDMNSAMYNYVASRWWSARGSDVDSINKPIEITGDTTIKAITIGPGRTNSEVVEFQYTVTNSPASVSGTITPENGGTVSLEGEVSVEVPPGAVTNSVELKIERLTEETPAAPAGFKFLGGVYQFSVDNQTSFKFNKSVTIKLFFDPESLGLEETPLAYYYDEAKSEWVALKGEASDDYVTVEVDHFTMFALMATLPNSVTVMIKPAEGGEVNLNDEAVLEIPAGALAGDKEAEVTIERLTEGQPTVPAGFKMLGSVYGFSVDNETSYKFNKNVTVKLIVRVASLDSEEIPAMYYYDEAKDEWVEVESAVSDNYVVAEIDHFTMFALLRQAPAAPVLLGDIAGHWAEVPITQLVAEEAISGYPDGTFRPDAPITRAEFATVLVKAFNLTGQGRQPFADTVGHWAAESVGLAVVFGIINGYDANTFAPDDLITREQLVLMVVRAARLTPAAEELPFADRGKVSEWARDAVATAVKQDIVKGDPENTFRPQDSATRAEAVQVVVNALAKDK